MMIAGRQMGFHVAWSEFEFWLCGLFFWDDLAKLCNVLRIRVIIVIHVQTIVGGKSEKVDVSILLQYPHLEADRHVISE